MGDKDSFWKGVATAGSVIGGAWVLAEIVKALSKQVYTCPNCKQTVTKGENPCHNCRAGLIWE